MSNPKDEIDTKLCLDDIRQKLNKIEDTELALDILSNLEKLDNQLADKIAVIAEKTAREETLTRINSQLFSKVSSFNERDKPSEVVDYVDIDRSLDKIINNI